MGFIYRRNQNIDPGTSQPMLDVVNSGSLMDESLIDGGLSGSPSAEDLLGGAGGRDGEDWNYDPSEPRYCVCNQVSYGDMVACDNEDVRRSFFYFGWFLAFNLVKTRFRCGWNDLELVEARH